MVFSSTAISFVSLQRCGRWKLSSNLSCVVSNRHHLSVLLVSTALTHFFSDWPTFVQVFKQAVWMCIEKQLRSGPARRPQASVHNPDTKFPLWGEKKQQQHLYIFFLFGARLFRLPLVSLFEQYFQTKMEKKNFFCSLDDVTLNQQREKTATAAH